MSNIIDHTRTNKFFIESGKFSLFVFILLLVNTESKLLLASETHDPFSAVSIRTNLAINTNRNTFHRFWDPGIGAELLMEMPFYLGEIQAGANFYSYNGKSEYQPDFLSLYIFIGWGGIVNLSSKFRWYNGMQIGSYQMHFDDRDIHESQALESELGVGLNTRFSFNLTQSWSIQAGVAYLYVYTNKPIELMMMTAGISYTFDAPAWLREFLK